MDDIWHGAGDLSTDMDWYAKRAFLGAIYTATELYMLTDFTPGQYPPSITSYLKPNRLSKFTSISKRNQIHIYIQYPICCSLEVS